MTWIVFVILMSSEGWEVIADSKHDSMISCFERREAIVQQLGEPIVNYQVVCARTNLIGKKV